MQSGDGTKLYKVNYHCNPPPVGALWQWPDRSLSRERHIKARIKFAPEGLQDGEKQEICCRDRMTGFNQGKDPCGQVQRYPGRKPFPECSEH